MPYNTPPTSSWVRRRVRLCSGRACGVLELDALGVRGPHVTPEVHLPTFTRISVDLAAGVAVVECPADYYAPDGSLRVLDIVAWYEGSPLARALAAGTVATLPEVVP